MTLSKFIPLFILNLNLLNRTLFSGGFIKHLKFLIWVSFDRELNLVGDKTLQKIINRYFKK